MSWLKSSRDLAKGLTKMTNPSVSAAIIPKSAEFKMVSQRIPDGVAKQVSCTGGWGALPDFSEVQFHGFMLLGYPEIVLSYL
jgi:hypothetical protein